VKADQWKMFIDSLARHPGAEEILRSGDVRQIAELARSKGFSFADEDIQDAGVQEASAELSGSALEGVSGGGFAGGSGLTLGPVVWKP
jgi:hypothetical protein